MYALLVVRHESKLNTSFQVLASIPGKIEATLSMIYYPCDQKKILKGVRSVLLSRPWGLADHILWSFPTNFPCLSLPPTRVSSASKNVSNSLI